MFSVALSNSTAVPRLAFPKFWHLGIAPVGTSRQRDACATRVLNHRRLLRAMSSSPQSETSTAAEMNDVAPKPRLLVVAVDETEVLFFLSQILFQV